MRACLLLALCVALLAPAASSERSVVVSGSDPNSSNLLAALADEDVSTIFLAGDAAISQLHVAALPLRPLPVTRCVPCRLPKGLAYEDAQRQL